MTVKEYLWFPSTYTHLKSLKFAVTDFYKDFFTVLFIRLQVESTDWNKGDSSGPLKEPFQAFGKLKQIEFIKFIFSSFNESWDPVFCAGDCRGTFK